MRGQAAAAGAPPAPVHVLAWLTLTPSSCEAAAEPVCLPPAPLRAGVLSLNLHVAFCREICLLHGLCDVDRPTLLARLAQGPGSAIFLAVGGAAESLLTKVGRG